MDALLLAAAVGASAYLPRYFYSSSQNTTGKAAPKKHFTSPPPSSEQASQSELPQQKIPSPRQSLKTWCGSISWGESIWGRWWFSTAPKTTSLSSSDMMATTATTTTITLTVSLALSLSLLTLSILDATPHAWLWLLNRPTSTTKTTSLSSSTWLFWPSLFSVQLSIVNLYRLLMWMMVFLILVVIPVLVAMSIMTGTGYSRASTRKSSGEEYVDYHHQHQFHTIDDHGADADKKKTHAAQMIHRHPREHHHQQQQQHHSHFPSSYHRHWSIQAAARALRWTFRWTIVAPVSMLVGVMTRPRLRNSRRVGLQHHQEPDEMFHEALPQHGSLHAFTVTERTTTIISAITNCSWVHLLGKYVNQCSHFLLMSLVAVTTTALLLMALAGWVLDKSASLVDDQQDVSLLATLVSWLCAVGILLSALLNGFGSVSLPHSCLAGLLLEAIPANALSKAEMELNQAQESLQDRKSQLQEQHPSAGPTTYTPSTSTILWPTPNASQTFGAWGKKNHDDAFILAQKRKEVLLREIDFLETLVQEMEQDLGELKESRRVAALARTPLGQIRSWIGVVFSIILLVRLVAAMIHVRPGGSGLASSAPHAPRTDPVTMLLFWMIGHEWVKQQDLNRLSQFISLMLTAILSFSQVQTFWRTMSGVHRRLFSLYRKCYCPPAARTFPRMGISSDLESLTAPEEDLPAPSSGTAQGAFLSHVMAALMGCYFLACIVLTKLMLPSEYSRGFSAALATHRPWKDAEPEPNLVEEVVFFRIRTQAVNTVFVSSAVVSVAVLGLLLGIQRQNTRRYVSSTSTMSAWPDERALEP